MNFSTLVSKLLISYSYDTKLRSNYCVTGMCSVFNTYVHHHSSSYQLKIHKYPWKITGRNKCFVLPKYPTENFKFYGNLSTSSSASWTSSIKIRIKV